MRALLALGNGRWPERRASDHLRSLCRGSVAIQNLMERGVFLRPRLELLAAAAETLLISFCESKAQSHEG